MKTSPPHVPPCSRCAFALTATGFWAVLALSLSEVLVYGVECFFSFFFGFCFHTALMFILLIAELPCLASHSFACRSLRYTSSTKKWAPCEVVLMGYLQVNEHHLSLLVTILIHISTTLITRVLFVWDGLQL